ncbi:MAG: redoxin domain-containing protein [Chthoniobacterales bacterium]
MKALLVSAAIALAFSPVVLVMAADKAPAAAPTDAKSELDSLVNRINEKVEAGGERTEQEFAGEIKEFDELLAKYKDEKSDVLAEAMLMKAGLYFQLLGDLNKAMPILKAIAKKYPDTKPGKTAAQYITAIAAQKEAMQNATPFKVGKPFPPFDEKDINGKPFSLAALKGKVVLVDFWATWCGPCREELPYVLAAYKKYHDKGFEIAGVSLDDNPEKLDAFLKLNGMTWPQYCDGQGFDSAMAVKYSVMQIPTTFLVDRKGILIAKNLFGFELDEAVARALGSD